MSGVSGRVRVSFRVRSRSHWVMSHESCYSDTRQFCTTGPRVRTVNNTMLLTMSATLSTNMMAGTAVCYEH